MFAEEHPTQLLDAARAEVRAAIGTAALRVERSICAGRTVLFAALLVRSALEGPRGWARFLANAPLLVGIVFSLWVIVHVRTPPARQWLWIVTVTIDGTAAFGVLSEHVLSDAADPPGLVHLADTSGLLLASMAAGLRLSVAAAFWGGAFDATVFLALATIERNVHGSRIEANDDGLATYLVLLGLATLVAVSLAVAARRVLARGAVAAFRAKRAERGLGAVLAYAHDARSLLTSVRLNAEAVASADPAKPSVVDRSRTACQNLVHDLRDVERIVLQMNERALCDLSMLRTQSPVQIGPVVERVVAQLSARFRAVEFSAAAADVNLRARVAGGQEALQRVLLNLLCNACEGDGTVGARHVRISAVRDAASGDVMVVVADDGPGLPRASGSTKAAGLGVGLKVVQGLVEASGGTFHIVTAPSGGATAFVRLPSISS